MRILFISLSLMAFVSVLLAQPVIQIDDFGATTDDLHLLGETSIQDEFLRLTPNEQEKAGACWLKKERIDLSRGFETEFEFRVIERNEANGVGDGFAFVIQNDREAALGSTGDGLGYGGITHALVLEFDTYNNGEGSSNHIDIAYYNSSTKKYQRHATVHSIPEITDGKPHFARIHYKDGFLTLFMDSYIFPVLSSKLDIESIIGTEDQKAWIGFTAATSEASACHDLMKWHVNYYLPPPEIDEEKIDIKVSHEIAVKSRKVKIRVKDYNKIDGDIVSLKFGDNWILTEYLLAEEPKEVEVTLTGFSADLIMFANDIGRIPPNTAEIVIDDGKEVHSIKLEADLKSSEAIRIFFSGEVEKQ